MHIAELLLVGAGKESVIYDSQLPEGIESVQHIQDMEEAAYRYAAVWFHNIIIFYNNLVDCVVRKATQRESEGLRWRNNGKLTDDR